MPSRRAAATRNPATRARRLTRITICIAMIGTTALGGAGPSGASHTESTHLEGETADRFNTRLGEGAGANNGSGAGDDNAFFGFQAGLSTSGANIGQGSDNSFFGASAGRANTDGSTNSFFGAGAGINVHGSGNAIFGAGAGDDASDYVNNTFIGTLSDGLGGIGLSNATALGYRARVLQSNSMVLGSINGVNSATADTSVGIGTAEPARTLDVQRSGATVARFKNRATSGDRTVLLDLENADTTPTQWRLGVGGAGNFFGLNDGQFYIQDASNVALLLDPTNSFLGKLAGSQNGSAVNNSFFGAEAGRDATGGNNAFFGRAAGRANSSGNNNAFFGGGSAQNNTIGSNNAFFGQNTGVLNTSGPQNAFFGQGSGANNTSGGENTFLGFLTGQSNSAESLNTFVGARSNGGTGVVNATALGHRALVTQSHSLVLGSIAGVNGGVADTNVGIGTTAPQRTLDVLRKGAEAVRFKNAATSGDRTILLDLENGNPTPIRWRIGVGGTGNFFGLETGQFYIQDANDVALLLSSVNSFFGSGAGASNTGAANTFVGRSAGNNNTTGSANAFFGDSTGFSNTTASNNAFFGQNAGGSNTVGFDNAFFGQSAGAGNVSGDRNAFFGKDAGNSNQADNNSFFGLAAGRQTTTGCCNAFFGRAAGVNNTDGLGNAFFGDFSGQSNTGEDLNTFLGASTNGATGISNATAVGALAKVSQSNSLVLGSIAGVNDAEADTRVGIGTATPGEPLHVRRTDGTSKVLVEEGSATTLGRTLFEVSNNGAARFRVRNSANGAIWDFQSSGGGGSFVIDRVGGPASLDFEIQPDGDAVHVGTVTATSFITSSDRNKKTDISPVEATKLMTMLRQLPISTWRFKNQPEGTINLGPMAQDFHRLFGMGTDATIDVRDLAALALVGIQALDARLAELES